MQSEWLIYSRSFNVACIKINVRVSYVSINFPHFHFNGNWWFSIERRHKITNMFEFNSNGKTCLSGSEMYAVWLQEMSFRENDDAIIVLYSCVIHVYSLCFRLSPRLSQPELWLPQVKLRFGVHRTYSFQGRGIRTTLKFKSLPLCYLAPLKLDCRISSEASGKSLLLFLTGCV